MEIVQKGAPRSSFKIKTSPTELRNVADQLEAMASNGNTLPGQTLTVFFRSFIDLEFDPEISVEKFARGIYTPTLKRTTELVESSDTTLEQPPTQAPGLTQ